MCRLMRKMAELDKLALQKLKYECKKYYCAESRDVERSSRYLSLYSSIK